MAVQADALQPERLLRHPDLARTLDLRQPLAVLLVAFLHLVPYEDQAVHMVRAYRDAGAAGSLPGAEPRHRQLHPRTLRPAPQRSSTARQHPSRSARASKSSPTSKASTW